jgi:hypothetical protein
MNRFAPSGFSRVYGFALTLFCVWVVYLCILNHYKLWAFVGVPHMEPLFADLHAILSARECHARGMNVFVSNPCDVMERIHVYGSAWLSFSQFNATSLLSLLGLTTNAAFMAIAVGIIRPTSVSELLISCLILFSPAVTLGVERANNDIVIFILVAISAALLTSRYALNRLFALLTICVAALLKIYPSILFGVALFAIKKNRKEFVVILASSFLLVAWWLGTYANEILLLKDLVPKPLDHYVTGANALFTYLGRPFPKVLSISFAGFLAIFFVVVISFAVWIVLSLNKKIIAPPARKSSYMLFVFGLSILFFTYTINTNYDYRWIFFVFLIPLLFEVKRADRSGGLASSLVWLCLICALVIVWTEAFRSTRLFGLYNFNSYFSFGRSTFSIELIQQYVKELAAWVLLTISLAFAIKLFPQR